MNAMINTVRYAACLAIVFATARPIFAGDYSAMVTTVAPLPGGLLAQIEIRETNLANREEVLAKHLLFVQFKGSGDEFDISVASLPAAKSLLFLGPQPIQAPMFVDRTSFDLYAVVQSQDGTYGLEKVISETELPRDRPVASLSGLSVFEARRDGLLVGFRNRFFESKGVVIKSATPPPGFLFLKSEDGTEVQAIASPSSSRLTVTRNDGVWLCVNESQHKLLSERTNKAYPCRLDGQEGIVLGHEGFISFVSFSERAKTAHPAKRIKKLEQFKLDFPIEFGCGDDWIFVTRFELELVQMPDTGQFGFGSVGNIYLLLDGRLREIKVDARELLLAYLKRAEAPGSKAVPGLKLTK